MMCQRIGRWPISTIGFGRTSVSSLSRLPMPPASMHDLHAVTPLDRSSASRLAARWASAIAVRVGFFSGPVVNAAAVDDEHIGHLVDPVPGVERPDLRRAVHPHRAAVVVRRAGPQVVERSGDRRRPSGVGEDVLNRWRDAIKVGPFALVKPQRDQRSPVDGLSPSSSDNGDADGVLRHHRAEDLNADGPGPAAVVGPSRSGVPPTRWSASRQHGGSFVAVGASM